MNTTLEWIYIGFTAMVAFFAFGWGIDDSDPNNFPKFLICAVITVIMFCLGMGLFPELFSSI